MHCHRSKWDRAVLLAVLIAFGLAPARALETSYLERLFDAVKLIGPQVANELKIAREDFEVSQRSGGWSADEAQSAFAWLDRLTITYSGKPVLDPASLSGAGTIISNARLPLDLPSSVAPRAQEVAGRLIAIGQISAYARYGLGAAVAREVEKSWLGASAPADLESAQRLISRYGALLFARRGEFPPMQARDVEPATPGLAMRTLGEEVFSAELLVANADPLLLPEPEKDPASYVRKREEWAALKEWNLHFLTRSAVLARAEDFDSRWQAAGRQTQRELERLILREAPAEELTRACDRLQIFTRQVAPFSMSERTTPATVTSYRDLLDRTPASRHAARLSPASDLRPVFERDLLETYRDVIAWLAEGSGSKSARGESLLKDASFRLKNMQPALREFLRERLAAEARKGQSPFDVPAAAPRENPRLAGAAMLQAIAAHSSPQTPAGIDSDRSLISGDESEQKWWRWSELPGSDRLFAERETAVRSALQMLTRGSHAGALDEWLRAALEKALLAKDWSQCQKLLAIDRTANVLGESERQRWRQDVLLEQAADMAPLKDARDKYAGLLRFTTHPAVAQRAAARLKSLPPKTRNAP